MTPQQSTKSDRPGATAVTTQPPRPTEVPAADVPVPLSRGWKFAVFLWGTSLVFLTLYEVLYTVFRYLFR